MAHAHITIHGRLAADPETVYSDKGDPRVKFRVGVTQGWGERKSTGWYGVVIFGKRGEFVQTYLHKGDEVIVSGELAVTETEKAGEKRTYLDVVASSVEPVGGRRDEAPQQRASGPAPRQAARGPASDDIPFAYRTVTPPDADRFEPRAAWSKARRA